MTSACSPYKIGLYVPQPCSLLTLGAIVETVAGINRRLDAEKYTLFYIADTPDQNVAISPSLTLQAQQGVTQPLDCQTLIVLAGKAPAHALAPEVQQALHAYAARPETHLLAFDYGGLWLLDSGIGLSSAWTWSAQALGQVRQRYPQLTVSHELYCHTPSLSSGCGQSATLDCLLDYWRQLENEETVQAVADALCVDPIRPGSDRQRLPGGVEMAPRLRQAIALMEHNLEDPLSSDELAEQVHISRRQLERLFKRHLDTMPARYYLQLRLKRARHLLQTTNQSVVQIGLMCGFSSGPHFSSAYKSYYAITPREERAKRFSAG